MVRNYKQKCLSVGSSYSVALGWDIEEVKYSIVCADLERPVYIRNKLLSTVFILSV